MNNNAKRNNIKLESQMNENQPCLDQHVKKTTNKNSQASTVNQSQLQESIKFSDVELEDQSFFQKV